MSSAAVGAVDLRVLAQGGRDPEAVIRLPGDHVAAGAHVARDVDVIVDEAEDPPALDQRRRPVDGRVDPSLGNGVHPPRATRVSAVPAPSVSASAPWPPRAITCRWRAVERSVNSEPDPTAASANSVAGPAAATRVTL